jgi:cob(I)alamin adenosyltransferase
MANRLTRITTRTGDDGTTGLAGGERVDKDHPRIEAIGSVDELNSAIGLLRAIGPGDEIDALLEQIQHRLFDLGGELSMPGAQLISDERVIALEEATENLNTSLPPLRDFILPGGTEPAARCHLARSVCRRAERVLWRLSRDEQANPAGHRYLNRLSDLLFVMARVLARSEGASEVIWRKGV